MEWQPIETAPKDGRLIDLHGKYKGSMLGLNIRITDCQWGLVKEKSGIMVRSDWINTKGTIIEPTHWQHPPSPPEKK